jgi:PAS domain S-box-containing protein
VPISVKNKAIGVLNIFTEEGRGQSAADTQFLLAMAVVLASVIKRKKAEADREKLVHRLQQAYDTVALSEREWSETFNSISDPVYIADADYVILKANNAFAAYLGLELQDVLNKKCYMLVHGTSSPPDYCAHSISMREHRHVTMDISETGTQRMFAVSAFPYHNTGNEREGTIMVMKDITEEREREMKMIMSERLAALGQMSAGIAHEINNPLTAMLGCAGGLLNRIRQDRYEPDHFREYLNIIMDEINRCKNITSGMLSFVRKKTHDAKDSDLEAVAEKVLEIVGFQGRLKQVAVIRRYREGLPLSRISDGELRQVLLSLITNAIDAMDEKGTITIETGVEASMARLSISDTGHGITADNLPRIFDPFFTTKINAGGTGLGLSIAMRILQANGGGLDVSSQAGSGSSFTISLPIATP